MRSFRVKEDFQDIRRHSTGGSVQAEFTIHLFVIYLPDLYGFTPDRIQVNLEYKDIPLQSLRDPKKRRIL